MALEEPKYEFVPADWDENLVCSLCCLPLVKPMTHRPCHNSFCLECVEKAWYRCPVCRKKPGKACFCPVSERFALKILGKVEVKCTLCSMVCPISEFEGHKKACDCLGVDCSGKELGCLVSVPKKELASHEKGCEHARLLPILSPLTNRISKLEEENKELRMAFEKSNKALQTLRKGSSGSGVGWVDFSSLGERETTTQLLSGCYSLSVGFSVVTEKCEVRLKFVEGNFDDQIEDFPFKGRDTIGSNLVPFRTAKYDTSRSEDFENFATKFHSSFCHEGWLASVREVKKNLEGNTKLWFSVEVERKLK